DESAAGGKRRESFGDEDALGRQIPVVQHAPHHDDVSFGQRITQEVSGKKLEPMRKPGFACVILKNRAELRQVETSGCQMRMLFGQRGRYAALRAPDIDDRLELPPGESLC